jgi:hypothetical protein
VLKYYGWLFRAEVLMKKLSKGTRKEWSENFNGYSVGLREDRKVLRYRRAFDSNIKDYLLKKERYKRFRLDLLIDNGQPNTFISFLKEVGNLSQLQFEKISSQGDNPEKISEIYSFIVSYMHSEVGLKENEELTEVQVNL